MNDVAKRNLTRKSDSLRNDTQESFDGTKNP